MVFRVDFNDCLYSCGRSTESIFSFAAAGAGHGKIPGSGKPIPMADLEVEVHSQKAHYVTIEFKSLLPVGKINFPGR